MPRLSPSFGSFQPLVGISPVNFQRRAAFGAAGYVPAAGCTPERRPLFTREVPPSLSSRKTAGAGITSSPGLSLPLVHPDPAVRQNPRQDFVQPLHRFALRVRPENRTWRIRNGGLSHLSYGQIVRAYQRD